MHHEEHFCEIILNLGHWFRKRCRLKDFLSGVLAVLLFSAAEPFMQFERGHHTEYSCEVIWNLEQWFRKRCLLDISYLELCQPLCSEDSNHLYNFG